MSEMITTLLQEHGHYAVFFLLMLSGVGIALGEEVIIIPAGIFIAQKDLQLGPTWICAYVGVIAADALWFLICARYGKPLLHRKWFKRLAHPRRLLEVKHQFEERGTWMIVMSRFIPGSRTTTITVAGFLHMSFWKFIVAEAACVLVTVNLQLGLGWLISQGVGNIDTANLVLWIIGGVVAAVAVPILFRWFLQHRAMERPPRAKMRWLRRVRGVRGKKTGRAVKSGTS